MIFNLHSYTAPDNSTEIIMEFHCNIEAEEAWQMLKNTFPKEPIITACWNGYDNAIAFISP
jgi:hypothetical protein